MTSWLRRMQIDKVALVDKGANPDADLVFFKRADVKKRACPECGEEMGEATKCPECGYTMEKRDMSDTKKDAERIAKLESDLKAAQDEVTKAKAATKDAPDVVALQKRVEDAEKAAKETTERLAKMEDARQTELYVRKVKGWGHLPVKADDFAPVLKRIAKVSETDAQAVEAVLEKANAAIRASGLLREFGGSGGADADAYSRIQAGAKALMQKDGKLTPEQAEAQFQMTPEGKALYREYEAEQAERSR